MKSLLQVYVDLIAVIVLLLGGALACYGEHKDFFICFLMWKQMHFGSLLLIHVYYSFYSLTYSMSRSCIILENEKSEIWAGFVWNVEGSCVILMLRLGLLIYFRLKLPLMSLTASQVAGLAVVSVICFTSSASVAIGTQIPVSPSCWLISWLINFLFPVYCMTNILRSAALLWLGWTAYGWYPYFVSSYFILLHRYFIYTDPLNCVIYVF